MLRFTITLLFILVSLAQHAQVCTSGRYLNRVFPNVTKTADIHYATVEALPSIYLNETQTISQNLYLDVFQPTGDTLQKRPLVILAFGGAFLIGTKNDADIQAACDSLAHLGYVTASIQYRLGLNPTNSSSGERAVYRSAQDYSAAVRYFKKFASTYRIDTSAIFVGGASAGSFAAMHMAYGEDDERPASSYGSGGLFPSPDLGCFDCSGNNYPYSHKVRGILNMWGALGYLDWIEPNDPPIVSFHGNMDPLVPYSQGYPFTVGATLPYVYGSEKITGRMQQLGIYNEFYTYESAIHQLWGGALESTWAFGPTEFQQPILNGIRLFLYKQLKPLPTTLSGNETVCTGQEIWYSVPQRAGFRYCWNVQNGQIITQNNHQLKVRWNSIGAGQVSVMEYNNMDFPTDSLLIKTVTVNQTPAINITGNTNICKGDTIELIANGADTYLWNNTSIVSNPQQASIQTWPQQNTTYIVSGTSSDNCSASAQWTVTVNPLPIAPIITKLDTILFIPQQYQTYQWYIDGNMVGGANTNTILISQTGTYTVQVGQGLGCYIYSYPYTVQHASISEWINDQINIFPNPFDGYITIQNIPSGNYSGNIVALTGQHIYSFQSNTVDGNLYLKMEGLAPGIYLLTLRNTTNGSEFRKKIIHK
jgi:acetyl esterase/lipase